MIKFKEIPNVDKPRERLVNVGVDNLSNEELIAIVLKTGSKNYSVKEVALKLLEGLGDITKLRDVGVSSLTKIEGIGKVKAIELKAAIELGRRVYNSSVNNNIIIKNAVDVYNLLINQLLYKKQEYFYCLYLDNKNRLIEKKCLFIGTIDSSTVHPREIFKEAYLLSASKIICCHNHPSGDVTPSKADLMLTRNIQEIAIIHSIPLVDHIIIGYDNYYSFHDNSKL